MTKPWMGYVAGALMLIGGILEIIGGELWIGVFLIVMSVVSFILRRRFIKKLQDGDSNS
jgi:membrane protein implicated in regulation of membrane protease activity